MTNKEQLHLLVDELAEDEAERALDLLRAVAGPRVGGDRRLPASLGIAGSGRADVSDRVDELLTEGFGR